MCIWFLLDFVIYLLVVIQVNPDYVKEFESQNLQFVGQDEVGQRMEMLELKGNWFSRHAHKLYIHGVVGKGGHGHFQNTLLHVYDRPFHLRQWNVVVRL